MLLPDVAFAVFAATWLLFLPMLPFAAFFCVFFRFSLVELGLVDSEVCVVLVVNCRCVVLLVFVFLFETHFPAWCFSKIVSKPVCCCRSLDAVLFVFMIVSSACCFLQQPHNRSQTGQMAAEPAITFLFLASGLCSVSVHFLPAHRR